MALEVTGNIKVRLDEIRRLIEEAYRRRPPTILTGKPQLVAVSKTKPVEDIIEAYNAGQRHFGENYVQELSEKANNPLLLERCREIKWHFIGHLQTNKINKILKVPGLHMIETVDSVDLADHLNNNWQRLALVEKQNLQVLLQVNTSGETGKCGVKPEKVSSLYRHIKENLPYLCVSGVMTIGQIDHDYSFGPNPDFMKLMQCHSDICNAFSTIPSDVHVSMGMSNDFNEAICDARCASNESHGNNDPSPPRISAARTIAAKFYQLKWVAQLFVWDHISSVLVKSE